MSELVYVDDQGRLRNSKGRFAALPTPEVWHQSLQHARRDEVCKNGCERWGNWWAVDNDCPKHLVDGAS